MTSPIEATLDVEEIDVDLYRSKSLWKPPGARGVFGGQVLGLALVAASRTVSKDFLVHSLHTYFLLPGNNEIPILYRVQNYRDGSTFATRAVHATQNGKVIFLMSVSFQKPEEGLEFQFKMPSAPPPEKLANEEDRLKAWSKMDFPKKLQDFMKLRLSQPFPIEIKHCTSAKKLISGDYLEPYQMIWIKANGKLDDDLKFHQCVAAYASDHVFLTTALLPHGLHSFNPQLKQMATLSHSMYFHAPFRADEYMLFEMECPRMAGGRGLVTGRLFSRDGTLVCSCVQEGVIRVKNLDAFKQAQSKL